MRPAARAAILIITVGAGLVAAAVFLSPARRGAAPVASGVPAQSAPRSSPTQRDAGEGAVVVEVTLVGHGAPEAARFGDGSQTVFLVSMNTHSVDLVGYDMLARSELRVAGRQVAPLRWVGTSDNNHHRSGALIFPRVDRRGALELRITAIAGVPVRIFRWAP